MGRGEEGRAESEPAGGVAAVPPVDEEWAAGWEPDRHDVMHHVAEAERWRTRSHGLRAPHEPRASPPLARLHGGPWVVLPVDSRCERANQAMRPFQWVAAQSPSRSR